MADKLCQSEKIRRVKRGAIAIPSEQLAQLNLARTPGEHPRGLNYQVKDKEFNQRLLQRITWRQELSEEIKYWRMWFETKGDEWPEDYIKRTFSDTQFDENLRQFIDVPADKEIQFLDVGSGPITGVGFVWPGRKIKITAVDPLADVYNQIMDEFGVKPPIRTQYCPGERISSKFGAEKFDMVHCRNALDHSYDPFSAIAQMLEVTKEGGAVVLDHYANEALHHNYGGLHQWNFDLQEGRFVLYNRSTRIDVEKALPGEVEIQSFPRMQGRKWILAVIRRKSRDKK